VGVVSVVPTPWLFTRLFPVCVWCTASPVNPTERLNIGWNVTRPRLPTPLHLVYSGLGAGDAHRRRCTSAIKATLCPWRFIFDFVLFCGDVAMNNFPSIRRRIIHLENIEDFYQSWQKIISINPKIIYPAHGKPFPVTDLKNFLPDIRKIKLFPLKNKPLIKKIR